MADDIVTRLRERCSGGGETRGIMALAADEIERLRAELAHGVEMLRIKDDLIDRQVRRILHLEGVRG